jgi:hypothetical protein
MVTGPVHINFMGSGGTIWCGVGRDAAEIVFYGIECRGFIHLNAGS